MRPAAVLALLLGYGLTLEAQSRRIEAVRRDRTVVVTGHGEGYVARSYRLGNREYVQRTYSMHGIAYARVYRSYCDQGLCSQAYVPTRYYAPAFYEWANTAWRTPVRYRWGTYTSPALWLADYIAEAAAGQAQLTPDVKQAIADEVQRQLALERAEAQAVFKGALPVFSEYNPHTLLVFGSLEATTSDGRQCVMSQGDVLALNTATVRVLASKTQDCLAGAVVSVPLAELQEFENRMRETMDWGLRELEAHQNGLPKPPREALRGAMPSPIVLAAPGPDADAAAELNQQEQLAASSVHPDSSKY